jgi:hypothetical protein
MPEMLADYNPLSQKEKFEYDKKYTDWKSTDVIVDYYARKNGMEISNVSDKKFLEDCQAALESTDMVMEKGKLTNMLARYGSFNKPVATGSWSD